MKYKHEKLRKNIKITISDEQETKPIPLDIYNDLVKALFAIVRNVNANCPHLFHYVYGFGIMGEDKDDLAGIILYLKDSGDSGLFEVVYRSGKIFFITAEINEVET